MSRVFSRSWVVSSSRRHLAALLLCLLWAARVEALVISEIMYHASEPDDKPYEFIELYNENIDPIDLSGYRFTNGVNFEFPPGTFLDGHSFLVICADEAGIQAKHGIENTIGNWVGALANGGEKIELANPGGRTVVEVSYNDSGKWPAGADGTGFSLSLANPFVEVDDPDNWFVSQKPGGTPGEPNTSLFQAGGLPSSTSGLDPSGFILRWLVLGPYTGAGCGIGVSRLNADWLREAAGGIRETALIWRDGQVVHTDYSLAESTGLHANAGTALPTIKEYISFGDTINLNDSVWPPDPDQIMGYAFVYVDNVTASPIAVDIAWASDDAISVLLNGTVVRSNDVCRAVGGSGEIQDRAPATLAVGKNILAVKVFEQGGGWAFRLRFEQRGTGQPITRNSKIQITTDPDKGLLFGGGGTPIEPPDEDPPPPPDPGTLTTSPVVINEGFLRTADLWIEFHNLTSTDKDLSGYHITNDPANLTLVTLPSGTVVLARDYLVLTAAQLGLDLSPLPAGENRFVALVSPDAMELLDAANFRPQHDGFSEARVPDGDRELTDAADPTPGAANETSASQDVVINEIMYHPIDDNPDKEFIELYNRGGTAVDLTGWRFSSGVNFGFPAGTIVPAGGYLVVGRDPALLRSIYGLGEGEIVGPEGTEEAKAAFGQLRDSGERITLKDSLDRTVDTLRYHDGGEWPRWPDGLGSSMERIDPFADNRLGQAWDASDDSGKAEAQEYSHIGRHGGGESEFDILLLAGGITVVDDVSIISTSERVLNGTFESNTSGWMIEGTHIRSGRTTEDPISGAGSLKIVASGRGDNRVNRIETPEANGTGLSALPINQDLRISFKARWVVGSQTLLTHGYEHGMAKAHSLAVPANLGTPGRLNSVTQRLIDAQGDANMGPLVADVVQEPVVPGAAEQVTVTARVVDPDGVASVTLRYSLTNPTASMTPVAMTPVGGDYYSGKIPGQPLGTRVVFYITARDSTGRDGRYPLDVVRRTHPLVLNPNSPSVHDHQYCVYRHDVRNPTTLYHSFRFWLTQAKEDELSNRKVHSNDMVQGSFVYGSSKIYHTSSMRFSGSPFLRGGWGGTVRVDMPRDNLLHGRILKFNLDNHGNDGRDRISYYLIRNNQGLTGAPYFGDQTLVRWQANDRVVATFEYICPPDTRFISQWYPDDDNGDLFKLDDRFVFNDSGGMISNADARLLYPPPNSRSDGNGANKENYRWFFSVRARNGADDYSNLIALARLFDPAVTSNAVLESQIFEKCAVEEMLRVWAVRFNTDDWDQWGASRGKNCSLYRPAISGLWQLIPWDMELTYGGTGNFIIPANPTDTFNVGGFSEVNRLLNLPSVKRMYYGILKEMVVGPDRWFHSSHLSTYMQKLAAVGIGSTDKGMPGGFIDQRAALLEPRINAVIYPQVRLTITTSGGNDYSTSGTSVNLAGTAPVEVSDIVVRNNDNAGALYPTSFPTMTTWSMKGVLLVPGANRLTLYGLDLQGNLVDSDTITITSTASPWSAPVIAEVNPPQGAAETETEILGTGFHAGLKVLFGTQDSPAVSFDEKGPRPDRIVAHAPPASGMVQVTVQNLDGKVSNGVAFTYTGSASVFIRGDANGDLRVDLSDGVKILLHLFSGSALDCLEAADVEDSGTLDITDAIDVLDYLFRAGPEPQPPFPMEGPDPYGPGLGCNR